MSDNWFRGYCRDGILDDIALHMYVCMYVCMYITWSLPLVLRDKRSCFSQGERFALYDILFPGKCASVDIKPEVTNSVILPLQITLQLVSDGSLEVSVSKISLNT